LTAPDTSAFEVPPDRLRWRPPRAWTHATSEPGWPAALLGQDGLKAELALLVATRGHIAVVVPESVDWTGPIGHALRSRSEGPVIVSAPATVESLRGVEGPGDLAKAHGGILVLDARDLLANEGALPALAEGLRGRISTQVRDEGTAPAHPARFAMVLLATDSALGKLREKDAMVSALFRRTVAVPSDLPRSAEGAGALLGRLAARGGLDGVPPGTAAWLLEEAAAEARRDRLALDIEPLRDIVFEARLARPEGDLERRHLRAAAERIRERRGYGESQHRARLARGQLRVVTEGSLVGVINGLMVYGAGKGPYAVPGRITARTAVGREGVVNIEREAKFSGRSYDKGVLQLHAFLRGTFAQGSPLSVVAGLTFEQSYGKVDGDSATLAKALAVLSDLSRLPARQDIAVTGGINPRGEVLPVGSVTKKAIGWWRTCVDRGLTGEQGFVLPMRSAPDLQLPEALVADVKAGRFTIWQVDHLDEAVGLLLGRTAGRLDKGFARGSVYALVARRLEQMSARLYPKRSKPTPKAGVKPPAKPANKSAKPAPSKASPSPAKTQRAAKPASASKRAESADSTDS
jgi:predicted ATP-dependent protease